MTPKDIEKLIFRTAVEDRAGFDALYAATSAKLFGICLRVLKDRAEAEDALQDIYIKVWRSADRYRANGLSPMTWLITIARNTAIDRLRARRAAAEDMDEAMDLPDATPGPEALALAGDERGRLAACLATLEPDRAGAVQKAYMLGYSYQELADHYGVPLNTIRTWLRRSLLKLRDCLSNGE